MDIFTADKILNKIYIDAKLDFPQWTVQWKNYQIKLINYAQQQQNRH